MPMVYIKDETARLIQKIINDLEGNLPSRIVKADLIHNALGEYWRENIKPLLRLKRA